jgi:hypothetical protein
MVAPTAHSALAPIANIELSPSSADPQGIRVLSRRASTNSQGHVTDRPLRKV